MAVPDKNIKQIKILKKDLPGPTGPNSSGAFSYDIRYRIVSDDKNRVSHWSQINNVAVPAVVQLGPTAYSLTHSNSTHVISLVWKPDVTHKFLQYDIFVAFNIAGATALNEEFEYVGSVSSPSFSTVFSTEDDVTIRVQASTSSKELSPNATIFQTPKTNL